MPPPAHHRRKSSINPRSSTTGRTSYNARQPRRTKRLVLVLRAIWAVAVLWAEAGVFAGRIWTCGWPDVMNRSDAGAGGAGVKVLVVADPQLPAMGYTYPERGWVLRWLSLRIIEQYLRKAWRMTARSTRPDAVVFLGDLLDGGVEAIDRREYSSYVHRFHRTFPSVHPTLASPSEHPLLHLAGNHDVGLIPDTTPGHSALARERFIHTWEPGALQGVTRWAGYEVVWIDAVGLVEEKREGHGPGPATRFVSGLKGSAGDIPRILFTHVPLYRPEGTSCGPHRESPRPIRQGGGLNYQNEVDEDLTTSILRDVQPTLVFSGDDHDYCVVEHPSPGPGVVAPVEVTVKSFSMAMGVRNPGYVLLTLPPSLSYSTSPPPAPSSLYRTCLLPSQLDLYLFIYIPLFCLTLAFLFGARAYRALTTSRRVHARQNGLPIHGHRKSLSRTLFFGRPSSPHLGGPRRGVGAGGGGSSEDDDGMISDYPTPTPGAFALHQHHHSASLGGGALNGSGLMLDDDVESGIMTPRSTGGGSDYYGAGPHSAPSIGATGGNDARTRRVSRMLFENAHVGGGADGIPGRARGVPLGSARHGIVGRIGGLLQMGIRRAMGPRMAIFFSRTGSRLRSGVARVGRNPLVRGGTRDLGKTLWPAGTIWVAVWIYFLW